MMFLYIYVYIDIFTFSSICARSKSLTWNLRMMTSKTHIPFQCLIADC